MSEFQRHIDSWHSGNAAYPAIDQDKHSLAAARMIWNTAVKTCQEHVQRDPMGTDGLVRGLNRLVDSKPAPAPDKTPFQQYMAEWPNFYFPSISRDEDAIGTARLIWNQACSRMKDYLREHAPPELLVAAFYTLLDQAFCEIAEEKPAGNPPEDDK